MKMELIAAASGAVLALTVGLGTAYAQTPDAASQSGATPSAPAAQQSGPSGENNAGGMNEKGQDTGASQSAGTADRPSSGKQMGDRTNETGDKAAGTGKEQDGKSAKSEGPDHHAKDSDRDRKSAETKDETDRKSAKSEDKDRIGRDGKSAETGDRDRMDRDRKSSESGDRDRADHDRKSGHRTTVKIDSDQKQKVRAYFSQHRPAAKRVEKTRISVSIGAPLPTGVEIDLIPLPSDIVVLAADCPLQYFVWGDDVVLVDSCSREVVDIVPNIG